MCDHYISDKWKSKFFFNTYDTEYPSDKIIELSNLSIDEIL